MDRFSKLVALAVLATAGTVHAGYAQLAPPAGFSGTPGAWTFAPSANQAVFGNVLHHPGALRVPVPGSSVTMPAAYRLAANAPRIAAGVIFMNPYIRTAVGIASWLGVGKLAWDEISKTWHELQPPNNGNGYEYQNPDQSWTNSQISACTAHLQYSRSVGGAYFRNVAVINVSECSFEYSYTENNPNPWATSKFSPPKRQNDNLSCPSGWNPSPAGCLSPQLTQPQFVELLNPNNQIGWPMPPSVPLELPSPTPLPIEPLPVINPEPGPNPVPRPLFVPSGDPVPNPQYDPNAPPGPNNLPWNQPGVRVAPSPTSTEPWRVDLQPVNRPVAGPEPLTQPDSETSPDADKPSQEQLDFCVQNPDVLACQKLDEPESQELPESEKDISISPDGGWGADNSACPAPKLITVQGRAIPIPFDLFCTWATGMRPIIIAMAWLSAAFILLGARNES